MPARSAASAGTVLTPTGVTTRPRGRRSLTTSSPGTPTATAPTTSGGCSSTPASRAGAFGSAASDAVVAYVGHRPGAEVLLTSTAPGEGSPTGFYLRYGFRLTGEVVDGETVLELDLRTVIEVTTVPRE